MRLEVFLTFFSLWALWFFAALNDRMLTVADMRGRGPGFERGIPLTGHWAMLYFDLLLPLLFAYLAGKYGGQWGAKQIGIMVGIGFILSAAMHYTYVEAGKKFPEAATYGGELTPAGWLHLVYMGLALALLGLFYFMTAKPAPSDVWLTSVWMIIHVIVGVHVPLKLFKPAWFPYHGISDAGTLVPILGTTAILFGLSLWALR